MREFFTVHTDAITGEVTNIPWTEEQIAAWHARNAAMQPDVPKSITRRQCALQLLSMQAITPAEALAMTKSGDVPAAVSAVFSQMPEQDRILAEIDFAADNYYRNNTLLNLMGLTSNQVNEFFIAASTR